jgi:hypothetical protein
MIGGDQTPTLRHQTLISIKRMNLELMTPFKLKLMKQSVCSIVAKWLKPSTNLKG